MQKLTVSENVLKYCGWRISKIQTFHTGYKLLRHSLVNGFINPLSPSILFRTFVKKIAMNPKIQQYLQAIQESISHNSLINELKIST